MVYVYEITAVPADEPVTVPVIGLTDATPAFDEVHDPPAVVLVKIVLEPTQAFVFPPIAEREGNGFTLTNACSNATHPLAVTV